MRYSKENSGSSGGQSTLRRRLPAAAALVALTLCESACSTDPTDQSAASASRSPRSDSTTPPSPSVLPSLSAKPSVTESPPVPTIPDFPVDPHLTLRPPQPGKPSCLVENAKAWSPTSRVFDIDQIAKFLGESPAAIASGSFGPVECDQVFTPPELRAHSQRLIIEVGGMPDDCVVVASHVTGGVVDTDKFSDVIAVCPGVEPGTVAV